MWNKRYEELIYLLDEKNIENQNLLVFLCERKAWLSGTPIIFSKILWPLKIEAEGSPFNHGVLSVKLKNIIQTIKFEYQHLPLDKLQDLVLGMHDIYPGMDYTTLLEDNNLDISEYYSWLSYLNILKITGQYA